MCDEGGSVTEDHSGGDQQLAELSPGRLVIAEASPGPSEHDPEQEEPDWDKLPYKRLQAIAKKHGLPCNLKTEALRELLQAHHAGKADFVAQLVLRYRLRPQHSSRAASASPYASPRKKCSIRDRASSLDKEPHAGNRSRWSSADSTTSCKSTSGQPSEDRVTPTKVNSIQIPVTTPASSPTLPQPPQQQQAVPRDVNQHKQSTPPQLPRPSTEPPCHVGASFTTRGPQLLEYLLSGFRQPSATPAPPYRCSPLTNSAIRHPQLLSPGPEAPGIFPDQPTEQLPQELPSTSSACMYQPHPAPPSYEGFQQDSGRVSVQPVVHDLSTKTLWRPHQGLQQLPPWGSGTVENVESSETWCGQLYSGRPQEPPWNSQSQPSTSSQGYYGEASPWVTPMHPPYNPQYSSSMDNPQPGPSWASQAYCSNNSSWDSQRNWLAAQSLASLQHAPAHPSISAQQPYPLEAVYDSENSNTSSVASTVTVSDVEDNENCLENLTLTNLVPRGEMGPPELPQGDQALLDKILNGNRRPLTLSACRFILNGCKESFCNDVLLHNHEKRCMQRTLLCFFTPCRWKGVLASLENHLRQHHGNKVLVGSECSHYVLLNELREKGEVRFIQSAHRRLFVIEVYFRGQLVHAACQWIPSADTDVLPAATSPPPRLLGCLEMIGVDGRPHSWRGLLDRYPTGFQVPRGLHTGPCLSLVLPWPYHANISYLLLHVSLKVAPEASRLSIGQRPRQRRRRPVSETVTTLPPPPAPFVDEEMSKDKK